MEDNNKTEELIKPKDDDKTKGLVEPKDKFDAHMRLAEYFSGRHDGRRTFELQISLSLWGAILAMILVLFQQETIPTPEAQLALFIAAVAIILLHGHWLYYIYLRNNVDKTKAKDNREAARLILDPTGGTSDKPGKTAPHSFIIRLLPFLADWSMRTQIITTIALFAFLVAVYLLKFPSS